MDYKEEQDGEAETLRAIYTEEEFNVLSESPWNFEITVKSEADDSNLSCVIGFTLPDTYPEVVPVISLSNSGQLTDKEQSILLDHINEEAQVNLGMPMVFTLVSAVQDKLLDFSTERRKEVERKKVEEEEEKKRAEEAKYKGTPVTAETFLVWSQSFLAELKEKNGGNKALGAQSKGLTGKKMFEKDASLVLSDARFLTEMDETEEVKKDVEIDESLFQDLGDLGDEELES